MLTLYVMRHAKSSWDDPDLSDYDRPLNKRGKHNAKLMKKVMKKNKMFFDLAYVSGAKRTRETFRHIQDLCLKHVEFKKEYYLATSEEILNSITSSDDNHKSILILNHEPTVKNLVQRLCSNFKNVENFMFVKFSTAAIATIKFNKLTWSEIEYGNGILDGFIKPKDYY